ncbi:Protein SLOW WALKER 1 [Forsythia ovata]|uniref:Protein SLOW WALKER 1 n=1 Tax=Forsythia ovata TaxID=205694 RepID=A0ABD1UCM3_9LAMI
MPHPPDAEESKRNLPPITTPNHSSTTKHTHYTHHPSFSSIRNPSTGNPSNTHYTLFPIAPHDFTVTHSANITIFSGKTFKPKTTIASAFVDSATSVAFRCDRKLLAVGYLTGQNCIWVRHQLKMVDLSARLGVMVEKSGDCRNWGVLRRFCPLEVVRVGS